MFFVFLTKGKDSTNMTLNPFWLPLFSLWKEDAVTKAQQSSSNHEGNVEKPTHKTYCSLQKIKKKNPFLIVSLSYLVLNIYP